MAFSLRKMLSNINYFKKSGDKDGPEVHDDTSLLKRRHTYGPREKRFNLNFDRIEPDSTSKHSTSAPSDGTSTNKCSVSDSEANEHSPKTKHNKKLKLDMMKANKSMNEAFNNPENIENTPKHVLLETENSHQLRDKLKNFDFNKSFDAYDVMMENSSSDLDSLSETDISLVSDVDDKVSIKMCRKVESAEGRSSEDFQLVPSTTPDSFGVLDLEKNEEERVSLLTDYQSKLENMDYILRNLLTEFKFHIEYSKVFYSRSFVSLPTHDAAKISHLMNDFQSLDSRGNSAASSYNVVLEREDKQIKRKLKKQLLTMKSNIDSFMSIFLHESAAKKAEEKKTKRHLVRSSTAEIKEKKQNHSVAKKSRTQDFPDLHEDLHKLFSQFDNSESDGRCSCNCHQLSDSVDSGLNSKVNDRSLSSQSVTSSIGNFSLDSITLSAYSESLEQITSFSSYQDSSLYFTLLQKPATERITFYIQVHSIEIKCEETNDFESKTVIKFDCPSCKSVLDEESSLLRHILSQFHCEKIHFLYKTAYIKKCVAKGKEIQPSTVLNPMTMYRDDNKIVCFGDAMYACTLCFENLIVGESVLMAHCADPEHIQRRAMMIEQVMEST